MFPLVKYLRQLQAVLTVLILVLQVSRLFSSSFNSTYNGIDQTVSGKITKVYTFLSWIMRYQPLTYLKAYLYFRTVQQKAQYKFDYCYYLLTSVIILTVSLHFKRVTPLANIKQRFSSMCNLVDYCNSDFGGLYCNSLFLNLPRCQLDCLQLILNSAARAVSKTPRFRLIFMMWK